jgi:DNA polymerase-1
VGLSFSWEAGKGFYIPVPADREGAQAIVDKFLPFLNPEP